MNFFNSIFSDDPQLSDESNSPRPNRTSPASENPSSPNPNVYPNSTSTSAWNFGKLIETIATKSESVIGNYKRDIEEFGSGLLKETAAIRDVASRAVKEFPDSIDAGAAVAQESLESVGQAIDKFGSSVWQGTAKIIVRGKELHLFDDEGDGDGDGYANASDDDRGLAGQLSERSLSAGKYSRLDVRMREIQCNSRTYGEEPEDKDDYQEWKVGFVLDDKGEEIENLMSENRVIERMYLELVPLMVDREVFWTRYFYKVYKLQQAEEARMKIVKRAILGDEEEEWSWDVDDDAEGKTHVEESEEQSGDVGGESNLEERSLEREHEEDRGLLKPSGSGDQIIDELKLASDASSDSNADIQVVKLDDCMVSEGKVDKGESCKDSDISVVSTQPSLPEEEELEWDEIEDIGSDDENRKAATTAGTSSNVSELRKRLTATEEEEDLSWDIEDDDEPIKS
ncbi:hypothetical protein Ancab_013460 [Ancistrocladus abbreviatus]